MLEMYRIYSKVFLKAVAKLNDFICFLNKGVCVRVHGFMYTLEKQAQKC